MGDDGHKPELASNPSLPLLAVSTLKEQLENMRKISQNSQASNDKIAQLQNQVSELMPACPFQLQACGTQIMARSVPRPPGHGLWPDHGIEMASFVLGFIFLSRTNDLINMTYLWFQYDIHALTGKSRSSCASAAVA